MSRGAIADNGSWELAVSTLNVSSGFRLARKRPAVLWEAIRAALAMRRRGGIAPSGDYLAWRGYTAYGAVVPASTADLVSFLEWRRRMRMLRR